MKKSDFIRDLAFIALHVYGRGCCPGCDMENLCSVRGCNAVRVAASAIALSRDIPFIPIVVCPRGGGVDGE